MENKYKYYVILCGSGKTDPSVIFATNNKRVAEKRCRDEKRWQSSRNAMIEEFSYPYRPEGRTNYSFFVANTTEFSKRKSDGVPILQSSAIVYYA